MIIHHLALLDINLMSGQGLLQSLVLTLNLHVHHVLCPESSFVIFQGMLTLLELAMALLHSLHKLMNV